jgi:hypothetical protein
VEVISCFRLTGAWFCCLYSNYGRPDQCETKYNTADFGRRFTDAGSAGTAISFDAQAAPRAVPRTVKPRSQLGPTEREQTAIAATLQAKRTADLEAKKWDLLQRVATEPSVCDEFTTDLFVDSASIPPDFANCTSLRELSIWGFHPTALSALIPQLGGLPSLRLFNFDTPTTLPDNLDQLHSLRTLWVSLTYGDTMPEVLRRMTNLTELRYTEGGPHLTVPDWLSELTQLTVLDLSFNPLNGEWPTPVFQLSNLRNLSVSACQLWRPIPEEITKLKDLVRLDLSDNNNFHSPAFLARLIHLQYLNVAGTGIYEIPSEWGDLVDVKTLALHGNKIRCLPQSVRLLPDLIPWVADQVRGYPVCSEAPLPLSFNLARNTACLWDPYYEFWYRAACDAQADTLAVTLYADSICRKKAKRRALHSLDAVYPHLGYCKPSFVGAGGNTTVTPAAYVLQYCQS